MRELQNLLQCRKLLLEKIAIRPTLALVLGSGLGAIAADFMEIEATVDYETLPGFVRSTVAGHRGRFLFGTISGVPAVVMQGRVHYYEGYSMQQVVAPIRVMGLLGASVLFLTNAAGGIDLNTGDLMLITDHISSFVPSPLIGENLEKLGGRFPDMTEVYDRGLRTVLSRTAEELTIPLREGVYVQVTGPNFETPAEIRLFKALGANAVGMSTVCEAIAARHMGMRVCGVSSITNEAAGLSPTPLSHKAVATAGENISKKLARLIQASAPQLMNG